MSPICSTTSTTKHNKRGPGRAPSPINSQAMNTNTFPPCNDVAHSFDDLVLLPDVHHEHLDRGPVDWDAWNAVQDEAFSSWTFETER